MPSTHAALAGGRAEPAGELGEVVGGVQPLDGFGPLVPVDQVVPLRDQVARAGSPRGRRGCRNPCSGPPVAGTPPPGRLVDLLPVAQSHRRPAAGGELPLVLEEAGASPMGGLHHRLLHRACPRRRPLGRLEDPAVVAGHHRHELLGRADPVGQDLLGHRGARSRPGAWSTRSFSHSRSSGESGPRSTISWL